MVDLDELWTIAEATAYLNRCGVNIKRGTLDAWIHRGHLPAERDRDGRVRVRPLDVARAEYATRAHARRTVAVGRAA